MQIPAVMRMAPNEFGLTPFDLRMVEPLPVADRYFHQAGLEAAPLHRDTDRLGNDPGRGRGSAERTGHQRYAGRVGDEFAEARAHRSRLGGTTLRERAIESALDAPIAVPDGFAVTDEVEDSQKSRSA
jgi:hypothetical protein